jgi:hypothetical protein
MMPTRRTARGNHVGLTVVGVVLLAAGLAGVAVGTGAVGTKRSHSDVLTRWETGWVAARGWVSPAVAAAAAVVALLCLRWLLVQVRRDGFGGVQLETDRRHGDTDVASRVLERTVADEISEYPGVARASARLAGVPTGPELHLTVGLRAGADIAGLRARIDDEAVVRLCQALETERLPLLLTLQLDVAKAVVP